MPDKRVGVYSIIINAIRVLLLLGLYVGFQNNRKLVMIMSIAGLIVTFLPFLLKSTFNIESPVFIEVIIIAAVYGSLFLIEVRGLFAGVWWWDMLLNIVAGAALGLIGLSIMYALYRGRIISANPFVMSFFALCFAVTVGVLWEAFEFALDTWAGFILQKAGNDTIGDLLSTLFGALVVSLFGYNYLKEGRSGIFSSFLVRLVGGHRKFLGSENLLERSSEDIGNSIKKGESDRLEFKSSLRTNLHTNETDKNIEKAVLKTMVAFLNSNGGTLLVGVSDSGDVVGLERDKFKDNDSLKLHLTNLIRRHIGSHFMQFIDFELFSVEDKHVLRIDCHRSDKRVFLKFYGDEEFYVRHGPSSVKLTGDGLIDYIAHRFR
ncbi:hypothetical protein CMI45_02460 [Candidatus Pacearchaeota archaeon]|nr:hypothetical protein [Candidatus Pacearchaeota archaeon]|tara:strand:- start:2537 stop:3664 length:1128 start_codon:yes stop_codon:yes gene_type:complete